MWLKGNESCNHCAIRYPSIKVLAIPSLLTVFYRGQLNNMAMNHGILSFHMMYIIRWDSALLSSDYTTDVFSAIAHTEVINEESDVVESEELGPMI